MKNVISWVLVICLLLTITALSSAQQLRSDADVAPVKLGLMGGFSTANFINTDIENPKARTGVVLGISFNINFLRRYPTSLETGLYYTPKGTQFNSPVTNIGENVDHSIELNYIVVPALLKYSFDFATPFYPFALLGPYIGLVNSANYEIDDQESGFRNVVDIGNSVNSTDYGGMVGAGTEFFVGQTSFSIQAIYSLGLNRIYEEDGFEEFVDADDRNSVFRIVAGIGF